MGLGVVSRQPLFFFERVPDRARVEKLRQYAFRFERSREEPQRERSEATAVVLDSSRALCFAKRSRRDSLEPEPKGNGSSSSESAQR